MSRPSGKSQNTKGMALGLAGFSSFALGDVCVKAMTAKYSLPEIIFFDHGFATLCLLGLLPFMGGKRALTHTKTKGLHGFRVILNVIIALIVSHSFSRLPIADVYTFLFTFPLFSALLAVPMYKQPLSGRNMIAIALGFAGVVIALQPGTHGLNTGMILPLFSALLIALMFLVTRSMGSESAFSLGFWPVCGTTLIMIPLMLDGFIMPPLMDLLVLGFAGVCVASGMLLVSVAFRIASAASVSPLQYTEMLWAILFGFLVFGDSPSPMMMAGAGLIILSGLWLVWHERG